MFNFAFPLILASISLSQASFHSLSKVARSTSNSTTSTTTTNSSTPSTCNGYSEFCDRLYSNVTLMGTHDSYSVETGSIAANQDYDISTQMSNGIRFLQAQGHSYNGGIELCHTSCLLLDGGSLETYLTKVKSFLDSNPDEVITILWVNSDDLPCTNWTSVYSSVGIDKYAYTPSTTPMKKADWPTYAEMISTGTRLVTFMDNGADYSSCPYIIDEFSNMWETNYDETDNSFSCAVSRIDSASNPTMYLANHFLDVNITLLGEEVPIPDVAAINQTNAETGTGSIGLQAEQCASEYGFYPTFILVDFYDMGQVFQTQAMLNGVTYTAETLGNGTTVEPTPYNSSSTTGTGTGTGTSGNTSGGSQVKVGTGMAVGLGMAMMGLGLGAF